MITTHSTASVRLLEKRLKTLEHRIRLLACVTTAAMALAVFALPGAVASLVPDVLSAGRVQLATDEGRAVATWQSLNSGTTEIVALNADGSRAVTLRLQSASPMLTVENGGGLVEKFFDGSTIGSAEATPTRPTVTNATRPTPTQTAPASETNENHSDRDDTDFDWVD